MTSAQLEQNLRLCAGATDFYIACRMREKTGGNNWSAALCVAVVMVARTGAAAEGGLQVGIAERYPGDVGIARDRDVVLVENFDARSVDEIAARWESVQRREIMSVSADVPPGSGDGRSLLMTHVGGQGNGGHLYQRLPEALEKMYVRFHVKFDRDCWPIHHFFHVGGYNPPTAWPQGGAGVRPKGDRRFTVGIEPHGKSWAWDYYAYWSEMGGSPPRGQTWGNSFIRDPKNKVVRDRWICMGLMMKLNDVGDRNGEMALWIDGRQVSHLGKGFPKGKWNFDKFVPGAGGEGQRWSDGRGGPVRLQVPEGGAPFEGFRWREDERQKLNFIWVLLYITKAASGHESRVWFDNIVVARDYIGPMKAKSR